MRAGQLRHRVTIQRPTQTQDAAGSIVHTWADYNTVWAEIAPVSGREFFAAAQVQSSVSTTIRIRYLAGVHEKMRVVHGSDIYDIASPPLTDDTSGTREMRLMCIKRSAEGFRDG